MGAVLLWLVKKLPRSSSIPSLTLDNVRSVALCYLGKLKRGKSDTHALDFATAAIEHLRLHTQIAKRREQEGLEHVRKLLKRVPHCWVADEVFERIIDNPEFADWLDFTGIDFELMGHDGGLCFLFENDEDRILFKLRWV